MIIGIDLGTTHCTLCTQEGPQLITQMIDQGWEGQAHSLPSFCYFPPEGTDPIVGQLAKDRCADSPERVVHSAKSWLCSAISHRRAPILPVSDCEKKISPIEASALYLKKLTAQQPLPQTLVVTVPASFDPSARQLVEEACQRADLPQPILLEEPLAAFYAWLKQNEATWRETLKLADRILVVDIGGGTTDFSLIEVKEQNGSLALERLAVGEHLLLGGDNMDLALAYSLCHEDHLDDWQLSHLVHGCRKAKEQLLGSQAPDSLSVHVPGRGSSLFAGSKTYTLTKQTVENLILEGFFPLVSKDTVPDKRPQIGLKTLQLPFAQEPRITAHLAAFLKCEPTVVLFNGGVMHAKKIKERLLQQLAAWTSQPVQELTGCDYDRAVSIGAVVYAQTLTGPGIRVKAPVAKSYFIGVEKMRLAVPGLKPVIEGICLVPKGLEEGSECVLEKTFTLHVGTPVQFRFFSSDEAAFLGQAKPIKDLQEHPLIETTLAGEGLQTVKLRVQVTTLGVMHLFCESEDQKWKLEFHVRESIAV